MQHKEEEREIYLENEEKRTENASAAAPYLGLALLTRPQADGSCRGSLGWRVAFGGGGGGGGGGEGGRKREGRRMEEGKKGEEPRRGEGVWKGREKGKDDDGT